MEGLELKTSVGNGDNLYHCNDSKGFVEVKFERNARECKYFYCHSSVSKFNVKRQLTWTKILLRTWKTSYVYQLQKLFITAYQVFLITVATLDII